MEIDHPLEEIIHPYFDKFKGLEGYFVEDDSALRFFRTHSANIEAQDILLKIGEVRDKDLIKDEAQDVMVAHILSLQIDPLLEQANAQLVNDIASVNFNGQEKNYYAFASRYCNYHDQDSYPIYDQLMVTVLELYFKRIKKSTFDEQELLNYLSFKKLMREFVLSFHIPVFNYRELDKFIWVYGREVIVEFRKKNNLSDDPAHDPDLNF